MNIEVPDTITREQLVAALNALGLDPALVYHLRMDAQDRHITVGLRAATMAAVTVDIPIADTRPRRLRLDEEPTP